MKDKNFGDSLIKSTFRIEWTSKNFFEVLKLDQLDKTMLLRDDKRLRQAMLQKFYVTDNFQNRSPDYVDLLKIRMR